MALFVEAVGDAGVVQRAPIDGRRAQLNARPGVTYRIVDENGAIPEIKATIKRIGDDLIVEGLPGSSGLQINSFFTECSFEAPCMLSLNGLGGTVEETITPLTEPLAATADGSFILKAPESLTPNLPTAPESEFPWKPALGGVAALGLAGGGGGGGGSEPPAAPVPGEPTVTSSSLTNDPTPVLSGQAVAGSQITLTLEIPGASAVTFITTTDASGNWSIDTGSATPSAGAMPTSGLPSDAVTTVLLIARSSGGSSNPVSFQLSVDTSPPAATASLDTITDDAPAITGAIANGATTNDPSPTLAGSLSEALAAGDVVRILRDGTPVGTATVNGTQWSFTDGGLADGATHRYVAQVQDAAGNASTASAERSLLTDFTAPSVPTIAVIATDDLVNESEARLTNPAPIVVNGTAEAGSMVNVVWGALSQSATAAGDGSWSVSFNGQDLADGAYSVNAIATDAAGNASGAASRPVQVLTGKPSAPGFSAVETDNLVNAAEAADGVVLAGTTTAGTRVFVTLDGVEREANVSAASWTLNLAPGDLPADGAYTATAFARDIAGNVSVTGTSPSITIDQVAPTQTVTITQAIDNVAQFTGALASGSLSNDQTPTIEGTVAGGLGAGETLELFRDGTLIGSSSSSNWSITDPGLSSQGVHSYTARVVDLVGNAGSSSTAFTLDFDNLAPAAASIATVAGNDAVNANEASAGVDISGTADAGSTVNVTWGGTTLSPVANGSGNWSVNFASGQIPSDGNYNISAQTLDAAGNAGSATTRPVSVDRTAPGVSITNDSGGTSNGDVLFTFDFSEGVSGFDAGDITVSNGSKGAFNAVSASQYTLVVSPTVSSGAMTVDVAGDVASDSAGNGNTAAAQSSVTIDQVPPVVTVSDDVPGTASGDVTFTFSFDEAVTGFDLGDITVSSNGTAGTFTAVSASNYTLLVSPDPDTSGTLSIDVAASAAVDGAGNASAAPASYTQAFDTVVPPSVVITSNSPGPAGGDITFTFTFNEAVNGFNASDVTISAGSKGAFTGVNGDTVYTLVVTPPAGSAANILVDVSSAVAQDLVGNDNLAATQFVQAYDTQAPTLSISDSTPGIANSAVTFTFTFSEAVSNFTTSDVVVTGGTKGGFGGSGTTFTQIVTPDASSTGNISVQVAAEAAQDAAGNDSLGAGPYLQAFDTIRPTVAISDDTGGTANGTVNYTFTFDEAVSGFIASDVTIVNGTAAGSVGTINSQTYTLAINPTAGSTGTMDVSVAVNQANDTAGNGNAASAVSQQAFDTRTVTITNILDNDNTDGFTGSIASGGSSDDETPTLSMTLGGSLGGGESVHVFRNGVDQGAATPSGGSTFSFTDTLASDGAYAYTAHVFNGGSIIAGPAYNYNFTDF